MATIAGIEEKLLENARMIAKSVEPVISANANNIASIARIAAQVDRAASIAESPNYEITDSAFLADIIAHTKGIDITQSKFTQSKISEFLRCEQDSIINSRLAEMQEVLAPKENMQKMLADLTGSLTADQMMGALNASLLPQIGTASAIKAMLGDIEVPRLSSFFLDNFDKAALSGADHMMGITCSALLAGVDQSLGDARSALLTITDDSLDHMRSALAGNYTGLLGNMQGQLADVIAGVATRINFADVLFKSPDYRSPFAVPDWIVAHDDAHISNSDDYIETEPTKAIKVIETDDADLLSVLDQALTTGKLGKNAVLNLLLKHSERKRGPQEPSLDLVVSMCTKYEYLKNTKRVTQEVFVQCYNDIYFCSLSSFKRYYQKFKLLKLAGLI